MGRKLTFEYVKNYIEKESNSGCRLISKEYLGTEELLVIIDRNSHEFLKSFHAFQMGQQTCPQCAIERRTDLIRLSLNDVYKEIADRDCRLLSKKYINTHSELEILFSCGHVGFRNLADFRASRPFCADCAPNQKLTYDYVKNFFLENGYILLSKKWNTTKEQIEFKDSVGYKYSITFGAFQAMVKRGGECERFGKTNPHSIHNIKLWIKENNKKYKYIEGEFVSGVTKNLTFKCLICSYNWTTSFSLLRFTTDRCPKCAMILSGQKASETRASGNSLLEFHSKIASEWDHKKNKKTPDKYASQSNERVYWICPKKGHPSYLARIQDRTIKGSGCPVCSDEQRESKVATGLKKWCKNNFKKKFHPEYKIIRNTETDYLLSYDIYLGEKKSTNGVYIEVHGGQHYKFCLNWHRTEKGFEDSKYRDQLKRTFAKRHGTYIEIDIRKIKTTEDAVEYVCGVLDNLDLQDVNF